MRLDAVRIATRDVPSTVRRYASLLGVEAVASGTARHRFQLGRGAVEIVEGDPGIAAAVFVAEGPHEGWPSDAGAFNGLTVLVETSTVVQGSPAVGVPVTAIDHVVVFTPDPARAIALWRDRLGLRLPFDREFPERKLRLLFFRSGGITLEVASTLPPPDDASGPDRFYGVSYRVPDLALHRAGLLAAGFDVSEIRRGNKAGTRVASVRSGTGEVPTLLLEEERTDA